MKKMLHVIAIIFAFTVFFNINDANAAEIVKQQGGIFTSPVVENNKVKISIKNAAVRYLRHTKYRDNEFAQKSGYKQLKASDRFTAFAYNCPGYYITRAYGDYQGSSLIGYVYVYVKPSDIKNTGCENLFTEGTKIPKADLNATHPIATIVEKSKSVTQSQTVTPDKPVTISNPTTIKESDKKEVKEPTAAEMDAFFAAKAKKDACLDSTSYGIPQYASNDGGKSWQCVDIGNCGITQAEADRHWYCSENTIYFNENTEKPTAKTVYYTIPDYSKYSDVTCPDDASGTEECTQMDYIQNNVPNGKVEPVSTYEEPEPEPEETEPPLTIKACKGEYAAYYVLFNDENKFTSLAMPTEYTEEDFVITGYPDVNYEPFHKKVSIFLQTNDDFSFRIANSNTLTKADLSNAQPCPVQEITPPELEEKDGLNIKACLVEGTSNQYELSITSNQYGEARQLPWFNTGITWLQYPDESVNIARNGGTAILTLDPEQQYDFAFEAERYKNGSTSTNEIYTSNVLTAADILETEECSTTGNLEIPGETNDNAAPSCEEDPRQESCVPDCYCPNLEKYGAGLGFMCCIWDCPGLTEMVGDFKGFLSDDLVGTATPPEVPTFEQDPPPNIFDVLNDVDTRNMPETPKGENAPGLEDSGFTADDVKKGASEIPVREDGSGGFNITDPMATLPEDGSTAPRPNANNEVGDPPTPKANGSNADIGKPPTTDATLTPPATDGSMPQPDYQDTATPPINYDD